jgi:hypothetical protein
MSEGTEHHLEEAHHAQHAAHDPFDRRVALSMAIVAATLAAVTLLSHRAHSQTLQNQIYANDKITDESDQWNFYQAKKNRSVMLSADAELLAALSKDAPDSDAGRKEEQLLKTWKGKAEKDEKDGETIKEKAEDLGREAKEFDEKSEHAHHQGNFFDLGELGIEMSLVLCSVALLTKRRSFWYVGLVIGAVGFAVAMCGFWAEPIFKVVGPYVPGIGG